MNKTMISIRLDTDLVSWFRDHFTQGYQTKMNQVLRSFLLDERSRREQLIGRAQEIYRQYHARCFWHLQKDLEMTEERIALVQEGLRKYGGREGFQLAAELTFKKD